MLKFYIKINEQINQMNSSISKKDMRKLQVLQNKVMRLLSGHDYSTPTKILLQYCNQLSIHQLVVYHISCQVYKIKN